MTPYGYRIVRGEALIDSEQALNIRTFFRLYLEGFTIDDAGHDAGIPKGRMATGMILSNPIYLGTDFYPRIIPDDVFQAAQAERAKRNRTPENLDRRTLIPVMPHTHFRLSTLPALHEQGQGAAALFGAVYDSIEAQTNDYAAECFTTTMPAADARRIQELFTSLTLTGEMNERGQEEIA